MNIAIVGRPNVGKSTLFNRLSKHKSKTGRKRDGGAIVADTPGVTRDRREVKASIGDIAFNLIDTAGLEKAEKQSLQELMMEQVEIAIEKSDLLLFVYDARSGLNATDEDFARIFRKKGLPIILIANKCEGRADRVDAITSYSLGFGDPVAVSAEHGLGIDELHRRILEVIKDEDMDTEFVQEDFPHDIKISIVGRPNVGKSTIFNKILKENRSIVADFHGTTRDSIYVDWKYKDKEFQLVDTAGIRKKSKRGEQLEQLSIEDSFKAIDYCNIAVLVIDASHISIETMIDKQDLALADYAISQGRGLVIALNKWDQVEDQKWVMEEVQHRMENSFAQAKNIPILTMSALNGHRVFTAIEKSIAINEQWNKRISTGKMNKWLEWATDRHLPPMSKGQRVRFKYITQVKSRPPTFAIFTSSNLKELPKSYHRYLVNSLCDEFGFEGTPVRLLIRKQKNPYGEK